MRAALDADAVLIPFGGGTSISGSLEAPAQEQRTVISLDVSRLRRVLAVDAPSGLARVQAGAFGPDLERQLNAQGWTLGHFPDSFTHSTLGGWIATRSSGMQSDRYGDIADLTRAVRVVTPAGLLVTRPVPHTSTGPSVREMVLGSEGRLGVITEATVQVRRVPERRVILGYLFPTWSDGLAAMRDIAESETAASVTRVSDANETAFSFATRKAPTVLDRIKSKALTTYLRRRRGFDIDAMCLSFIGYEGTRAPRRRPAQGRRADRRPARRAQHRRLPRRALRPEEVRHAVHPGLPARPRHARRRLRDGGAVEPAVHASTTPSSLPPTAPSTSSACAATSCATCRTPTTRVRACTSRSRSRPRSRPTALSQYDRVKSAIQQAFIDTGATLSHHHAVGTEHARWLEEDISAPGVAMLQALFSGVDPGANLNPGKIV